MAVIEKRKRKDGKIQYRVKVRLKGHPSATSTHNTLRDAERWAKTTEAAIHEGRHFKTAEAKKHTLGDLVDRYLKDVLPHKKKGLQCQKAQLLWWKDQIGSYTLADVTPALIVEKRDELARGVTYRHTQRSPATVVRYLAALSHAFTIAVREWGWLEDSPMRKVSKPRESRGRVRFLEEDELSRLLEACKQSSNKYLYPVVLIAVSTGMRYSEIINLKWPDIDFERKRIILHETKNGERRAVPIAGPAFEQLLLLEEKRRIDTILLFPREYTTPTLNHKSKENHLQQVDLLRVQKVQKPINLRSSWEKALKSADIKDFRFHDLRHCAASYLAMSGASLTELADILGHKSLSMVKRYSHLTDNHKFKVVDKMNAHFLGRGSI